LFNSFVKTQVEIITERDHFVHVSGHPAIEELKHMYDLTRPQIVIPVHGEPAHIHEHAKLARKHGVKCAIEAENGAVILLDQVLGNSKVIGKVQSGYLAVDGHYLLPADSKIFKMRRRMRDNGLVVASIVIDKSGKLLVGPSVSLPGVLDEEEDQDLIHMLKKEINDKMLKIYEDSRGNIGSSAIQDTVQKSIRRFFKQETNKSPVITVEVISIEGKFTPDK
jgi:ribonuclease J